MKRVLRFIKKVITHNHCDSCGFTKDEVYLIDLYCESGLIQCKKCYNKTLKSE